MILTWLSPISRYNHVFQYNFAGKSPFAGDDSWQARLTKSAFGATELHFLLHWAP